MDISKLIYAECHNPQKIRVYDGIKNAYVEKHVPCGKCYHCKITKINEWVTRMVVQSNYSKFVYFGTLTYNGKRQTILNDECLSIRSNFNKTKTYNNTPLILRKDHLQNFFKRLRKNTGIKFQYACCGEYGSTYSRPHYHYIIWSNTPISTLQVYKAWSAPLKSNPKSKAVIGKIEHRDIKNNPYLAGDKDNTAVFKYVCKYIQKFDFKFEELTNYKQHVKCYEKEFKFIKIESTNEDYYTGNRLDEYLKRKEIKSLKDYKRAFSPFFHCSKQPAIGYQYLQDNLREFQKANFKLFGLSGNYIFPLYFIRKTKESLCPLKAASLENDGITSYSRLPKMAALIRDIQIAQQVAEDTDQIVQLFRYNNYEYTITSDRDIQDLIEYRGDYPTQFCREFKFKREYIGFVDTLHHVEYSFRGNYFAMYNTRTHNYIGKATLQEVHDLITYHYELLKTNILRPLSLQSAFSANKKNAMILDEFGSYEEYENTRNKCLIQLMNKVKYRQSLYKQTKTFE